MKSGQRLLQPTDDAGCTLDDLLPTGLIGTANHLFRSEEVYIDEPYFLGYFEVDTTAGIVDIGVHREDGNMTLYGFDHCSLNRIGIGHLRQLVEDERVMRDDEVAAQGNGLVYDQFVHVQTQ